MRTSRIAAEVMNALADAVPSVDVASLSPAQKLGEPPLDLDSLDTLQLLLDVTKRVGIDLKDDEDLTHLGTLGSLIARLEELVSEVDGKEA